jgi:anti-sigma factor RsiW
MATDRQDIDALLIGALYGELDGDERTRLDAHLASHPQDRSALDDMRSTRAMLRDAELMTLLGAAEPSPAISARLIQEAARRAPVRAAGVGFFAFLASLFRPLVASPALSAAAALVLVGGAAGVLYSRGSFKSSEPLVSRPADRAEQSVAQGPAATTGARTEAAPMGWAGQVPSTGTVDDYRVSLEEGQAAAADRNAQADLLAGNTDGDDDALKKTGALARKGSSRDATVAPGESAKEQDGFAFADGRVGTGGAKDKAGKKAPSPDSIQLGVTDDAVAQTRPGYIAVDPVGKDAPTVLKLDASRGDADVAKREAENKIAEKSRAAGPGGGGSAGASPPADAPPPAAAPQKPAQVARDQGKSGTYNAEAARALEIWARDQHARMVKLVNQGKCTDVGAIGLEISRKAPDYYAANVANDRQIRSCRSYVDRARRAKSDEAKTKAAAPRSPAPAPEQDMDSSIK